MSAYDLRPLTLGEVLDRAFSIYRNHFLKLIGIAALALVVPHALYIMALYQVGRIVPAGGTFNFAAAFVTITGTVVMLVVYSVVQAASMHAISELYLGRGITIGGAYGLTAGAMGRVLGLTLLQILGVLGALLLLIIPGILLALRWMMGIPALVIEDLGPGPALSRSMRLTSGMAGRMFMASLIQFAMSFVVAAVLTFPFTVIPLLLGLRGGLSPELRALSQVGQLVSNVLVYPLGSAMACVLYYDLRVRKEGFDLEQMVQQLGRPAEPALAPPPVTG